jgi:hypothetical protein
MLRAIDIAAVCQELNAEERCEMERRNEREWRAIKH